MTPPNPSARRKSPTLTQLFAIPGPVPFLDVKPRLDNRLFLDPTGIRLATDRWAARANLELDSFFTEVLRCRSSTTAADHAQGLALLGELHEPNETRLGMSAGVAAGHAIGPGIGQDLWDELGVNPAFRAAVLRRLDDLRVFVNGVGNDLISDLTTRVVFGALAAFTTDMVSQCPSLAAVTTTETINLWDVATKAWIPTDVTLPHVAGRQLLLVPRDWVYWRTLMDPDSFYNRFATQTVQLERTKVDSDGNVTKPSKAAIKRDLNDIRGLNNQQAAKYMADGVDLLSQYRRRVESRHEPMTDQQIADRLDPT